MNQVFRPLLLTAFVAGTLGVSTVVMAANLPHVDKNKASYLVGMEMASQLPPLVREEINPDKVADAVKDILSGKKPELSKTEAQKVGKAFNARLQAKAKVEYEKMASKNQREGAAFLAKNKSAPGVHVTKSGLQYKVIRKGSGRHPTTKDTVQVEYTGTFINGRTFDTSAAHPSPKGGKSMPIPLSSVIPGFREGLQMMRKGAHYKFWIPASLAYGSKPRNGFPPNATIIFDVKLDSIKAGK